MTNDECKADFRVDLAALPVLAEALRIPDQFVCPNRTVATGMESLCVVLRRFAYPCRFSNMIPRFGRSVFGAESDRFRGNRLYFRDSWLSFDGFKPTMASSRPSASIRQCDSRCWWCVGELLGLC